MGLTPSEQYLAKLGMRSFLSLWSYPTVYYARGKELTDLLVVCGKDVVLFQDKWSAFPDGSSLDLAWKRWFRRTVEAGSKQAWGAERTVRRPDAHLFLDPAATTPLPVQLPHASTAVYHLVVVTHGASSVCRGVHGGSGSLMLWSLVQGFEAHSQPFVIGDADPSRTFVHVLDDTTLEFVLRTLDTITDFTQYLTAKVELLRGPLSILAAGEEELLAHYLTHTGPDGRHGFILPTGVAPDAKVVSIGEGFWEEFEGSPARRAQLEEDRISYTWDAMIETFNHFAAEGTGYKHQEVDCDSSLEMHEKVVRFMALENRFSRRILAHCLSDFLAASNRERRSIRFIQSPRQAGLYYVFVLLPMPEDSRAPHDEYRRERVALLRSACLVVRLLNPDAMDLVGIATEAGPDPRGHSEDALYFDARQWTPDLEATAKELQSEGGILARVNLTPFHASEYSRATSMHSRLKNPRNKPCPCGSGKKYKKCCLGTQGGS